MRKKALDNKTDIFKNPKCQIFFIVYRQKKYNICILLF